MIKLHQKSFIESIPFEKVNTDEKRSKPQDHNNIDGIENKITRFQIYPETEVACKNTTTVLENTKFRNYCGIRKSFILKTGKRNIKPAHPYQNHKVGKSYIPVKNFKNARSPGEKFRSEDRDSTRLQVPSLMNYTYFAAIHYFIHLNTKLYYTISRIYQRCHYLN